MQSWVEAIKKAYRTFSLLHLVQNSFCLRVLVNHHDEKKTLAGPSLEPRIKDFHSICVNHFRCTFSAYGSIVLGGY